MLIGQTTEVGRQDWYVGRLNSWGRYAGTGYVCWSIGWGR